MNCAVTEGCYYKTDSRASTEYVEILIYQAIRNRWLSLPVELRAAPSYAGRRNQARPTSQTDDQSPGTYRPRERVHEVTDRSKINADR